VGTGEGWTETGRMVIMWASKEHKRLIRPTDGLPQPTADQQRASVRALHSHTTLPIGI